MCWQREGGGRSHTQLFVRLKLEKISPAGPFLLHHEVHGVTCIEHLHVACGPKATESMGIMFLISVEYRTWVIGWMDGVAGR